MDFLRDPRSMFGNLLALLGYKHDHYKDFGWPETVTFDQLYRMFTRNGLATAAVNKTVSKTWQESPEIWESEKPAESPIESEIRQRFAKLRVWQMLAEADRRSLVGPYGAVILRVRDGKRLNEPVGRVAGGLDSLVELIPCWASQLVVTDWEMRETEENFGAPKMYQFNESAVGARVQNPRQLTVHPDRVIIWSADGTIYGRSALEAGYNDLIDAEKVKGAGGEGFWKAARGAPVITAGEGLKPADVAKNMGVQTTEVLDKINRQVDDFNSGFDKALLLGGMTAQPMSYLLPTGDHYFNPPVQCFAASFMIPVKILLGSQTGERASTEDADEWAQTNMARRVNYCIPLIHEFIDRLKRFGLLENKDWVIDWADLTDASADERMGRATKMSEINAKPLAAGDDPVFTTDEIREAAGYEPFADLGEPFAEPEEPEE